MKKVSHAAVVLLAMLISMPVVAQDTFSNGEVKKIDEAAGKITLKHGPIMNLDMEENGMTMVFRVRDLLILRQLSATKSGSRPSARAMVSRLLSCRRRTNLI